MNSISVPSTPVRAQSSVAACPRVLPTPFELKQTLPLSSALAARIEAQRDEIRAVLEGRDDRLIVVVGPCSIHDPVAALDYAERLKQLAEVVSDRLLLVMRVYVEKPRTTVGWKGLAYDPHLDGSDDMAMGLRISRKLMHDIVELGLPVATELLQPMAANYFDDLLAWAAIGARTTESQIHRELISGLKAPAGFKNGTDGGIDVVLQAIASAASGHRHFGMDEHGRPAVIETAGNAHTHLVLRGGHRGPNFAHEHVTHARLALEKAGIAPRIMVDCSHANSGKDPRRQPEVLYDVLEQRLAGETALVGVMLESHLFEGRQAIDAHMRYGVSVTDGCLGWDTTAHLLSRVAERLR